jgi:hypothetical protein
MAPGEQLKQPPRAGKAELLVQKFEIHSIDVGRNIDDIDASVKAAKAAMKGAFRTEGTGENALNALPSDNKKLLKVLVKAAGVGVSPDGAEALYLAFLTAESKNKNDLTALTIITQPDNKTVFAASNASGSQIPDYLLIEKTKNGTIVRNIAGDKV